MKYLLIIVFGFCKLSVNANFDISGNSFSIIKSPSNQFIRQGSPVSLDCVVSGDNRATITWKKDGKPLKIMDNMNRKLFPNGTLYIESTSNHRTIFSNENEFSDDGKYECVADSAKFGVIKSTQADVFVAGVPDFLEEPLDLVLYEGEVARFSCSVSTQNIVDISWFKNSQKINVDHRIALLPSGALEIDQVMIEDGGKYYCSASNYGQSKLSRSALLQVKTALALRDPAEPAFMAIPISKKARVGDNVTLDCAANGYPKPSLVWLKDGDSIDMQDLDSRFMLLLSTHSLLIMSVQVSDEGTYMCRAQNERDSVDAVATLSVIERPRIIEGPSSLVSRERHDVIFSCVSYGRPEPVVTWYKDGKIIEQDDYFKIEKWKLRVLGLVRSDSGMYQCFASNEAGRVQASARLTVTPAEILDSDTEKNAPSKPRHLESVVKSSRFVTLSWLEPQKNNDKIVSYSVVYRHENSGRERIKTVDAMSSDRDDILKTQVSQLSPQSTYLVKVVAHTSDGLTGAPSQELQFTTAPDLDLPDPPTELSVIPVSSTALKVRWSPPPETKTKVTTFVLSYLQFGTAKEKSIEISSTAFTLKNLNEFTEYSVWVAAKNANGVGDPTHEVTALTFSASPSGPPLNVTAEAISSRSVILRWEPPEPAKQNGIITGYKIRHKKKGSGRAISRTTDGGTRLLPIKNLQKDTQYSIKLSAMTVNGSGPSTSWISVRTLKNDLDENRVPGKPASIRAIAYRNSIEVEWRSPASRDVLVRGYRVGWGKGFADERNVKVGSNQLSYLIHDLEVNADYVLTVRAFNDRGDGLPIYEQKRTLSKKQQRPTTLTPPVGLATEPLTPFTISLEWTDMTLNKNQYIGDRGYYTVRYRTVSNAKTFNGRYKYVNVSDVHVLIDRLKPSTAYEFSVKAVKGRRVSSWSLVGTETTLDARPSTAPRHISIATDQNNPFNVIVTWDPPKQANGKITGYFLFYTTDPSSEWLMQEIEDSQRLTLKNLSPEKTYYYKMQAKNSRGLGPFSAVSNFTTEPGIRLDDSLHSPVETESRDSFMIFVIGGVVGASIFILAISAVFIICRRNRTAPQNFDTMQSNASKTKVEVKPPDLWIHHDHLELKNLNKSEPQNSPVRTATLGHAHHLGHDTSFNSTSTLDRRTPYHSGYLREMNGSDEETEKLINRRSFKPKPLMISIAPSSAASTNADGMLCSTSSSAYSDATLTRKNIYNDPNNANLSVYSVPHYPPAHSQGYLSPHDNSFGSEQNNGMFVESSGTLGKRGNPLRSFTVPAPPQSAPTTPQIEPMRLQLGSKSPLKLPLGSSQLTKNVPVYARRVLPDHAEAISEDQEFVGNSNAATNDPSVEEISQECANLENMMSELSKMGY